MLIDHLEKIKHFQGVVRYGSIRKYSIKENISQSAVSKSMQILESALDTPLFVRKRTGVELTQAGTEVLKFGEALNQLILTTETKIQKRAALVLGGNLKIGSYQSISIYFMPKLIKFIKENQENLRIDFLSDSSTNLIKKVKSKEIDICISVNPKSNNGLENTRLYTDYFSAFKHIGFADNIKSKTDIYTFLEAQDGTGTTLKKHTSPLDSKYKLVSCGNFETAKAMVQEKLGLAILPNWVAQPLIDNGTIEKIKLPQLPSSFGEHSIGLSYKKSRAKEDSIIWVREQTKIMLGV